MAAIYIIDILGADIVPLLLPNVDFIFPMKILVFNPNTTMGYWSTFLVQDFVVTTYGLFYATFNIIFIIFAVHLLEELKTISLICRNVGKYEKNEIVADILNNLNTGISKRKQKHNNAIGSNISYLFEHDEKSFAHAFKEFQLINCFKETDQVRSSILIDIIIQHHNETFR